MTPVILFSRDALSESDREETDKPKRKENGIQKLQGCEKIRKKQLRVRLLQRKMGQLSR